MRAQLFVLIAVVACNREPAPEITTSTLDPAVVGEVYTARLAADGGEGPLRWTLLDGELPEGLVFNPAGAISGVPARAGDASVTVQVQDARERVSTADLDLSVIYSASAIPCGESLSGRFSAAAFVDFDLDLELVDGYAWVQIPLPLDDTTRVELFGTFDEAFFGVVYLGLPGTRPGDTDLDHYDFPTFLFDSDGLTLDLGTSPSLQEYAAIGDALTVLFAVDRATDWTLTTACSNGPIFRDLLFLPTRLGDDIEINYSVEGGLEDQLTTRIWTDDPLPDWLTWDESTGLLTGLPPEAGVWEYTVFAEDDEGRVREEHSGFGVYEPIDLACGESFEVQLQEMYYEGELYSYYDPRGYAVIRTPMDEAVSLVGATLTGGTAMNLGFASPASTTPYYAGGASTSTNNGSTLGVVIDPRSWPSIQDYQAVDDEVYTIVYSRSGTPPMTVQVDCESSPRPAVAALPVLPVGTELAVTLEAIGGLGEVDWSAAGLPAGVSLSADGELASVDAIAGTTPVDLTVTDAEGASSTTSYDLHVGWDAACVGAPLLACGASTSGTFVEAFGQPETLCLGDAANAHGRLRLTTEAGDGARISTSYVNPGQDARTGVASSATLASPGEPATLVIGETSSVPIEAWTDLPVFIRVRGFDPGDWSVALQCE
jgi:hypothetical protein